MTTIFHTINLVHLKNVTLYIAVQWKVGKMEFVQETF